jgi:poly-beta-1,6-N-acetyl-D-glucosamine synthase
MKKKIAVSVGITTYNEEQNIGKLLQAFLEQKKDKVRISEILVISSGSTDETNTIVKKYSLKYKFIKLIKQKKRLGKASAVNLFLSHAKENILILSSADLALPKDTVEKITAPFKNKHVGIVGSHPVPLNNSQTFFGFAAHLLWNLHHTISLTSPKMGEFIAFRKVFKQIPELSGVDEANIEAVVKGQGYKVVYASSCIIYNKGAETLNDFITRRRYIYAGHLATKYEYGYEVSTLNPFRIGILLLQHMQLSWRFFLWTPVVIVLEFYSRILGLLDFKLQTKPQPIWEIAKTTKNLPTASTLSD